MIHTRMKLLRCTILSASFLAMMLRTLLYATAIDQKGLLTSGHWCTWSILILTGLILGILLLTTRKIQDSTDSVRSFLPGASSLLAACVIFQRSLSAYSVAHDRLNLIAALSGFAAALALLIVGICRMMGTKPNFLFHSAVSIFFALQLISQYRNWSADPQLMDYCFYLAAFIFLMFTAYFLAAFDADMGRRRGMIFSSMAATYFCCLALPESGDAPLLLSCALWAFAGSAPVSCKPNEETET